MMKRVRFGTLFFVEDIANFVYDMSKTYPGKTV